MKKHWVPRQEREEHIWRLSIGEDHDTGLKSQRYVRAKFGGEGGIRTHGRVTPTAVFETARFGRSRTSPM